MGEREKVKGTEVKGREVKGREAKDREVKGRVVQNGRVGWVRGLGWGRAACSEPCSRRRRRGPDQSAQH